MSSLIVSEKTLELNICAEILAMIRSYPRCKRAFWIGMTQKQEARLGTDEIISNVPPGRYLALQFKAPRAPRSEQPDQIPYRFTINDRQNNNLLRLASSRPRGVYYVLPHYNTFKRMRLNSPNLLRETYFLKVADLQGLAPSTNRLGTHMVETNPPTARVLSGSMQRKITIASKTISSIFKDYAVLKKVLISHENIKKWLYALKEEEQGDKRAVGQRLRGFSICCIS